MLVISRKKQETIYIGTDIEVTVKDIRGGKVILGIDAPAEVKINRLKEHADELKKQSKEARLIREETQDLGK